MKKTEIEKRIRAILQRFTTIDDGEDSSRLVLLTEGGLFDSVTAFEMILELEKNFSIVIHDDEVCAKNLESFAAIARFVEAKLSTT